MNKEFVPHEQSLELKELGFDEPCILLYRGSDIQPVCQMSYVFKTERNSDYNDETNYWLTVPTFSQAFRWFREKYNLDGYMSIDVWHKKTTTYSITGGIEGVIEATSYGDLYDIDGKYYDTYEEAELECLIKLIKIVKEKK